MWNAENNPYGEVPAELWIGGGGMAIAEVTKHQYDKAMVEWEGAFFGVE